MEKKYANAKCGKLITIPCKNIFVCLQEASMEVKDKLNRFLDL